MGGAVQIGLSLCQYAVRHPPQGLKLTYAVSSALAAALPDEVREVLRPLVVAVPPSRVWAGRHSRRQLRELERASGADLVYSVGFPSYVRFARPEVGRYTNPWEMLPNPLAWATVPPRRRPFLIARTTYRRAWAKRATWFETQTDAGLDGIVRHLGVAADRIAVFPNSANPIFQPAGDPPADSSGRRDVLCLAAAHPHKNLGMVVRVAQVLAAEPEGARYRFVLTLPPDHDIWRRVEADARAAGVSDAIVNVGPLSLDGCVDAYRRAHAVFQPTLLEVFSATYVEAMAMERPIVTSDLPFARSICGEAARYHDPLSPEQAAAAIRRVCEDAAVRTALIAAGRVRRVEFPSSDDKHRQLFDWLRTLAEREAAQHR